MNETTVSWPEPAEPLVMSQVKYACLSSFYTDVKRYQARMSYGHCDVEIGRLLALRVEHLTRPDRYLSTIGKLIGFLFRVMDSLELEHDFVLSMTINTFFVFYT